MDKTAFDAFYEAEYWPLLCWLRRHSRGDSRCEDWAQEAFTKAWAAWPRFDGRAPAAWVQRIARNVYLDDLRRGVKRVGSVQFLRFTSLTPYEEEWRKGAGAQPTSPEPEPETQAVRAETRRELLAALHQLSVAECQVLWQHHAAGVPERDCASARGQTLGTVKSRLLRARRRLRAVYEAAYGASGTGVG